MDFKNLKGHNLVCDTGVKVKLALQEPLNRAYPYTSSHKYKEPVIF
jgi:hypothetical protein